jgi:hypothetical protein
MAIVNVPEKDWCQCQSWRLSFAVMNYRNMNFCPFCGSALVKAKDNEDDDERNQHTIPRAGYFYVGRLAAPERLTVFHILKDGEYNFLCGMQKPVGAVPPPDIPSRDRCCRNCLQKLREIPSEQSE